MNEAKTVVVYFKEIPEVVSIPNTPTGPSSGKVGQSLSFSTGGSSSNLEHPVEYQFDWGDVNQSSWGSSTQSYIYSSSGTKYVKVHARCQTHTSIVSGWSSTKSVSISYCTLTINVSPSGSGSVTKNPNKTNYNYNESVQLTANSNSGYEFDHWDGALSGSDNPKNITMSDDKSVTAYFTQIPKVTLTVSSSPSEHDLPNPSYGPHQYDQGETVNASVTSPADESGGARYSCTGYSGTGSASSGSVTSTSFTINQNSTLTWNWKTQYKLQASSAGNGSVSPSGTNWYDSEFSVTLTANPDDNYQVDYCTVNGSSTGSGQNSISVIMNEPKTVVVYFKEIPVPPLLTISEGNISHNFGTVEQGNNPDPDSYTFTVKNTGGETLSGSISESANWLSLTPTSFSLTQNQTQQITVTATTNSLEPDSYSETISITSNGGNESGNVEVTITQAPVLNISSGSISHNFGIVEQGNNPDPNSYTFTVKNTGGGTLSGNISESANWLSLTPTSFSLTQNQTQQITVTATTNSLEPDSYSETISISSNGGDESGNIEIEIVPETGVTILSSEKPDVYELGQNFPNPFNSVTEIHYKIPEKSHVKLIIYNSKGEIINTLVNSYHSAGCYSVKFNGSSSLSTGIYLYRIITDDYVKTKKCMYLK